MFYGYHQALCLQRLKGDGFMDSGSSLHYLHSSEIISLSSLNSPFSLPTFAPHLKQSSRYCKGKEKKNKLNESILHKGHKMNRFPTLNSFKMNDYLAN